MTLYYNRYRVESTRLHKFDYTRPGAYFVTIRIKKHKCSLVNYIGKELQLTSEGQVVKDCWHDLPEHYNNIVLDEYVIMPDHFHGIIIIVKSQAKHSSMAYPNLSGHSNHFHREG